MTGVNLIPYSVLGARRRSRRIRQWTVVVVIAAAVAAVPVLVELRQHALSAKLVERQQIGTAKLAEVRAELEEVNVSLRQLRDGIERANTLRTRRPWAGLLTRIVSCMPQEVWLTSIGTEAPESRSRARPAPPVGKPGAHSDENEMPSATVVTMAGAQRLDLAGFALDHEQLYEFMTRLKRSETFGRVELVMAGKQPVLRSEGVRFELTCTW